MFGLRLRLCVGARGLALPPAWSIGTPSTSAARSDDSGRGRLHLHEGGSCHQIPDAFALCAISVHVARCQAQTSPLHDRASMQSLRFDRHHGHCFAAIAEAVYDNRASNAGSDAACKNPQMIVAKASCPAYVRHFARPLGRDWHGRWHRSWPASTGACCASSPGRNEM